MANIAKTPSGKYKATIRRSGWPTSCKSFRTKRDAEDWARGVEDEMVRGVYINRAPAERLTVDAAVQRYLAEVTISKRPTTQAREKNCVKPLQARLGKYSLAALTPDVVAAYRDCIALKGESLRKKHAETASTEFIVTD